MPSRRAAHPEPPWPDDAAEAEVTPAPLPRERVRAWSLVLAARGVAARSREGEEGWRLFVPAADLSRARRELALYERENRGWPPPPPAPLPERGEHRLLQTAAVLLLLAAFHNLTQLPSSELGLPDFSWTGVGAAHAGKILRGELWRTVTALTLHADYLHLAGNCAFGAILLPRLIRLLGGGPAWFLVLATGLLGNLANAWAQPWHHQAVGSSTALFGALGLGAGIGFLRRRGRRRMLVPLLAGAGLLAWLGAGGERTDLGAHLFGFLAGLALALPAARLSGPKPPSVAVSRLLAGTAVLLPPLSWLAAILLD